jgi:hypothetical protein
MKKFQSEYLFKYMLPLISFMMVTGCYSSSETIKSNDAGTVTIVKYRVLSNKGMIKSKYKVFTFSNKLIEKGRVSERTGCWPEVIYSNVATYDTLTGSVKERNIFQLPRR